MNPAYLSDRPCRRRNQGFTLIELMVVLVIIGVAASAVRLAVVQEDPLEEIQRSAEQFAYTVGQAQDRVLLSNKARGIFFLSDGVKFLEWREGKSQEGEDREVWSKSEAKPVEWEALEDVRLTVQIDGYSVDLPNELPDDPLTLKPHVFLLPSEDYTPAFELIMEHRDSFNGEVHVTGDGFNRLEVTRVEN